MKLMAFKKLKDNRYKVSIKEKEDIILYDETILEYELLLKKEITDELYEKIINYNNELSCYFKALKYLGHKMRTKKEISDYLKKNDFKTSEINKALAKLEKQGYVNEKQYIKSYISDQVKLTLNGPDKIKRNLISLNLNETDIEEYLEQIDETVWQEKIEKIIDKRKKTNKDSNQKFKLKTGQYLQTQGYKKSDYQFLIDQIEFDNQDVFLKKANTIYKKLVNKYNDDKLYLMLKQKLYMQGFNNDEINDYIKQIKKGK